MTEIRKKLTTFIKSYSTLSVKIRKINTKYYLRKLKQDIVIKKLKSCVNYPNKTDLND